MDSQSLDPKILNQNQSQRQLIRKSLQKTRIENQKLMVFQVLTAKLLILSQMTSEANKISKKALGVNVCCVNFHPNCNIRAFSFVFINAFCKNQSKILKSSNRQQQINNKVDELKSSVPQIKNYILHEKFSRQDMYQIFSAMFNKILNLIQGGLQISQIIKAYCSYLDITSFFLRSILCNIKYIESDDCHKKLSTNQVYAILSQYFDIEYLMKKDIYLFPQLKVFIASPDDNQFIFGKYYENVDQLQKNENQIRQSTIQHINQANQNYQSLKISKMNLDITMSGFMQERFAQAFALPLQNKAPTPQFKENVRCFQQLLDKDSCKQSVRERNPIIYDLDLKQSKQLFDNYNDIQSSSFIKDKKNNMPHDQLNNVQTVHSPAATTYNFNNFHTASYLQQFDFYRGLNPQRNQYAQAFGNQRVLLKGSSMVEKGEFFMQQVTKFKKEKEQQLNDRQMGSKNRMDNNRDRIKTKINKKGNNEQQIKSANTGNQQQDRSRNHSTYSHNPHSQKNYSKKNKSDISKRSKKSVNNMRFVSEIYNINIASDNTNKDVNLVPNNLGSNSNSNTNSNTNILQRHKQKSWQQLNKDTQPNLKRCVRSPHSRIVNILNFNKSANLIKNYHSNTRSSKDINMNKNQVMIVSPISAHQQQDKTQKRLKNVKTQNYLHNPFTKKIPNQLATSNSNHNILANTQLDASNNIQVKNIIANQNANANLNVNKNLNANIWKNTNTDGNTNKVDVNMMVRKKSYKMSETPFNNNQQITNEKEVFNKISSQFITINSSPTFQSNCHFNNYLQPQFQKSINTNHHAQQSKLNQQFIQYNKSKQPYNINSPQNINKNVKYAFALSTQSYANVGVDGRRIKRFGQISKKALQKRNKGKANMVAVEQNKNNESETKCENEQECEREDNEEQDKYPAEQFRMQKQRQKTETQFKIKIRNRLSQNNEFVNSIKIEATNSVYNNYPSANNLDGNMNKQNAQGNKHINRHIPSFLIKANNSNNNNVNNVNNNMGSNNKANNFMNRKRLYETDTLVLNNNMEGNLNKNGFANNGNVSGNINSGSGILNIGNIHNNISNIHHIIINNNQMHNTHQLQQPQRINKSKSKSKNKSKSKSNNKSKSGNHKLHKHSTNTNANHPYNTNTNTNTNTDMNTNANTINRDTDTDNRSSQKYKAFIKACTNNIQPRMTGQGINPNDWNKQ